MDSYMSGFLEEFGEPENTRFPDKTYIENYRDKLPDALLSYWAELGFCRFMGGLFWIVDPEDYVGILDSWIEGSPLKKLNENFYVIARSGYGDLYIWAEKSGCCYEINAANGRIFKPDNPEDNAELELQLFFGAKSPDTIDIEDEDTDEEMFELAVNLHGPLEEDEMFAFEPSLVLGGGRLTNNLHKVNLYVHLDIILQLQPPQVIGIDDLADMAFS